LFCNFKSIYMDSNSSDTEKDQQTMPDLSSLITTDPVEQNQQLSIETASPIPGTTQHLEESITQVSEVTTVAAEPVVAESVVAEPIVAEPFVAEPVVADPIMPKSSEPITPQLGPLEPPMLPPLPPIDPPITAPKKSSRARMISIALLLLFLITMPIIGFMCLRKNN